jgi:hypothetical protein
LSQTSQHDANHGHVNPGFFTAGKHLVVFGEPTKGAKARRRCARQSSGGEAHESRWVGSAPNRSPHLLEPRRLASHSRDVPQSRHPSPASRFSHSTKPPFLYALSAQMSLSRGKQPLSGWSNCFPPLWSWRLASWTSTLMISPVVSTSRWRLRPLTFFPPS